MDLETLKEEVRARSDVVDVIGSYVTLKKAGGTYKGLCPFHQEKTPSFNVDPRKQIFHCFGCGEGGDVFKFVMAYEKADFMEALERLAGRVGIPFEFNRQQRQKGPKKDRLYEIHQKFCQVMEDFLENDNDATAARLYLQQRRLKPETLKAFRVGYAADRFDAALTWARKSGFTEEELVASGLFSERETPGNRDPLFDRFRGRIMFPIQDELGRVIGFSGRVLRKEQSPAKYVNSPETLLFKKSRVLFAIDKARQKIADSRQAILCEGQLDVIRCHEVGLTQSVAAQGTAITDEHAKILRRYADEVILLLDADVAGVKAALRSSETLLREGISIRVARLPEGEDPDSLVLSKGEKALHTVVEDACPFIEFQIDTLMAQEGDDPGEAGKLRVAAAVVETIQFAKSAIQREGLLKEAADHLGVSMEALTTDVQQSKARPARSSTPTSQPRQAQPPTLTPAPTPTVRAGKSLMPDGEKFLFELLCNEPELIGEVEPYLKVDHLRHPKSKELLDFLYSLSRHSASALQDAVRDGPLNKIVTHLLMHHRELKSEDQSPQTAVRDLLLLLRKQALEVRLETLQKQMRESSGEEAEALLAESWQLRMVANKLQEAVRIREWELVAPILKIYD